MAQLTVGPVHHIRLSVNDLDRSRAFYTDLLGFQVAMDALPPEDDPTTRRWPTTSRTASC